VDLQGEDSNGYLGSRLTDEDLEKIDLVLLDIKAWDRERHHQLTGMDIAPVLDFARRLAILRKPIWLRYVLVAGLTDDAEDIAQIANFVAGLGNVERVDVLPFHQLGAFKWKQLGIEYKLLDAEPPQKAIVERACTQFQAVGLKAY
jgi:pyruvate formate lyase activating enzyme